RLCTSLCPVRLEDHVTLLTGALHDTFGYQGDTSGHDGLGNVNLMCTIERRRGTGLTLGILYLHAARAARWGVSALTFPGRFLIRLQTPHGQRAVLDPLGNGEVLTSRRMRRLIKEALGPMTELIPAHYQPMNNRDILLRLQDDVKTQHLRAGRLDAALKAVETMLIFAPDAPGLWREVGLIQNRLGNVGAALLHELYGRL
ncbi:MAG: hypothetical protein FD153_1637, partial [Rhodospirillaceae bacterium]